MQWKDAGVLVDAIILTGGRSSRLDFVPKADFVVDATTLLERTLHAASPARRLVVVGPTPFHDLPEGVILVREEPPFGGPAAAIAAGLTALEFDHDDDGAVVLVLACDMPHVEAAVPVLLSALEAAPMAEGVLAVEADGDGAERRQPLAAAYRMHALREAVAKTSRENSHALPGRNPLSGMSMFRFIDGMNLLNAPVPPGATADVDTWDDAVRLGAVPPDVPIIDSALFGQTPA